MLEYVVLVVCEVCFNVVLVDGERDDKWFLRNGRVVEICVEVVKEIYGDVMVRVGGR